MNENITLDDFRKNINLCYDFLDFFLNFKPYFYQKEFIKHCINNKRIAGRWCRQSGKSTTVAAYCLFRCLVEKTSIMITAPTQTQSNELYFKIREMTNANPVISSQVKKLTETELQLTNGSRIKALPTGSEGKSMRGFTADIIILEEAQNIKDVIVNTVITPMIASKGEKGQVIKIGTTLTKNHFYRSCVLDNSYSVVSIDWKDAVKVGQITKEFIDEQMNQLTDVEFKTEYGNEFIDEHSMFFTTELVNSCCEDYNLIEII